MGADACLNWMAPVFYPLIVETPDFVNFEYRAPPSLPCTPRAGQFTDPRAGNTRLLVQKLRISRWQ
jgi:hypothetical protein